MYPACWVDPGAEKEIAMPRIVRISREGKIYNQDYRVRVNKNNNDDVLWIDVENGGPWTIVFDAKSSSPPRISSQSRAAALSASPVTQSTTEGSKGSTGGPVNGVPERTYRYNVKNAAGQITDDPDVDVE